MEKLYQDYLDKNTDDYGSCVIRYLIKWAELMEQEIQNSNESAESVILKCAENLSYEADTEGITGFMYGCAVSILYHVWEYGEILRKWHNKEYNYEGDGVVNPAVFTIK